MSQYQNLRGESRPVPRRGFLPRAWHRSTYAWASGIELRCATGRRRSSLLPGPDDGSPDNGSLGERWLTRLAEKAGSAWSGQNARMTGRGRRPSGWMVAGSGAADRGALLVIRSWYTDGALLAGARPGEKSSCLRPRRTELAFPMCRTRWFRRVMGMPRTDERPRWRGPPPTRLSWHLLGQPRGHASTASGHGAPATGAP